MSDEQTQLSTALDVYTAAYAAHKAMYEMRNPPPVVARAARPDYLTISALIALVTASVIVSGSRTIIEFGGGLVGGSAFVMLELGIVGYGFIRTKSDFTAERSRLVKRLTTAGMVIALVVALAANVHATLKANGAPIADWIDVSILLSVALAAPVLAFISGDVLGMEAVGAARRKQRVEAEYKEAMDGWRTGLDASWRGSDLYRNVKVSRVTVQPPALADVSTVSSGRSGRSVDAQSPKWQATWEYLQQHPEATALSGRDLGKAVGVSKSLASEVKAAYVKGQS